MFLIVYAIFALYIINAGLEIISLPEAFLSLNKWIFLIIGGLLVLAGFKFFRSAQYY